MKTLLKSLVVAMMAIATATAVWSADAATTPADKIAPQLRDLARGGGIVDVIVQFVSAPTNEDHRRMAGRGAELRHQLDVIKAAHYRVSANALENMAADPRVAFITTDHAVNAHVTGMLDQASPTIGANLAYQFSVDGTGIGVALVDSGIGNHDDLRSKVVFAQNETDVLNALSQDEQTVVQDQLKVNADQTVVNADNASITSDSTTVAADTTAYNAAAAAQVLANTALTAAQAAQQAADQAVVQAQTPAARAAAQAADNTAHANTQNAQQADQAAQQATQNAKNTLQQAQAILQQAQMQWQHDQQTLRNDKLQLSKDSAQVTADAIASSPPGDTDDQYGHGTHVAGIIAGSGKDSTGNQFTRTFKGIAGGVSLINLKVLDQNGNGTDSLVIQAIQTAIALKSTYNIRVMNLSLGRPVYESYAQDPLCQAVEQAWQSGIVVVVAAGNYGRTNPTTTYGYGTITAPGNDPFVITVGAMNDMGTATKTDDIITSYSSKGPTAFDWIVKPDIVAPGNMIDSTLAPASHFTQIYPTTDIPMDLYQIGNNQAPSNRYLNLSGTSMATPFVSGSAALLLQQNPSLTPDQVKARLMLTASKTFPATSAVTDPTTGITYYAQYDVFTIGAGYLNVDAALSSNAIAPEGQSAMSPAVSMTGTGRAGTAALVTADHAVWGSTGGVFDLHAVWGSQVGSGSDVVWSSAALWGSSNYLLSALHAVWGSNVVWSANVTSTHAVWGSGNAIWGAATLSSAVSDSAMNILTGGDR